MEHLNKSLDMVREEISAMRSNLAYSESLLGEFQTGTLLPVQGQGVLATNLSWTLEFPDDVQIRVSDEVTKRFVAAMDERARTRKAIIALWKEPVWNEEQRQEYSKLWGRLNDVLRETIEYLEVCYRQAEQYRVDHATITTQDACKRLGGIHKSTLKRWAEKADVKNDRNKWRVQDIDRLKRDHPP